jgi:integrase
LDTRAGRDPRRRRTHPLLQPGRAAPATFEFLAYTGLRIGEALGLTWADIELDAGLIRMHRQLSRKREHAPLKTEAGRREVVLAPAVAKLLHERWLASSFKAPHHLVFGNTLGRGLDYRDVGEAFRATVNAAASSPSAGSPCILSTTASPRC